MYHVHCEGVDVLDVDAVIAVRGNVDVGHSDLVTRLDRAGCDKVQFRGSGLEGRRSVGIT